MNREILFRGKRADSGEWIESNSILQSEFCGTYLSLIYWIEIIPETLGRYTGLTDKNGKKVFEGDIVWDGNEEGVGVIEFYEGEFVISFDGTADCDRIANAISYYTVCGNIHDNPELVRKDEENGSSYKSD